MDSKPTSPMLGVHCTGVGKLFPKTECSVAYNPAKTRKLPKTAILSKTVIRRIQTAEDSAPLSVSSIPSRIPMPTATSVDASVATSALVGQVCRHKLA